MNNKTITKQLKMFAKEIVSGLKSRQKLYLDLEKIINSTKLNVKLPKSYKDFSNEIYGKKAFIYFDWGTLDNREKGERILKSKGYIISDNYSKNNSTSEIRVSYFKGLHWDE